MHFRIQQYFQNMQFLHLLLYLSKRVGCVNDFLLQLIGCGLSESSAISVSLFSKFLSGVFMKFATPTHKDKNELQNSGHNRQAE
ncbi:hypothetical protein SY27_16845 [Flavobacterium sp. 316]|nr:hypothetical protein SY27_16845 [Flavobacterium sp. 316]